MDWYRFALEVDADNSGLWVQRDAGAITDTVPNHACEVHDIRGGGVTTVGDCERMLRRQGGTSASHVRAEALRKARTLDKPCCRRLDSIVWHWPHGCVARDRRPVENGVGEERPG